MSSTDTSLVSTPTHLEYASVPTNTGTITITTSGSGTGPGGWGITWPTVTQPIYNPNIQFLPNIPIVPMPSAPTYAAPFYGMDREALKSLVKEALMEMFAQLLVPAEAD